MKKKKSIEEQVAELTEEQKNKVLKFGSWSLIAVLLVFIPQVVVFILATAVLCLSSSLTTNIPYLIGWGALFVSVVVTGIAYFVIMKIVCPYYSDRKYNYIKKHMKKN